MSSWRYLAVDCIDMLGSAANLCRYNFFFMQTRQFHMMFFGKTRGSLTVDLKLHWFPHKLGQSTHSCQVDGDQSGVWRILHRCWMMSFQPVHPYRAECDEANALFDVIREKVTGQCGGSSLTKACCPVEKAILG
jgi:hypothetical protein